MASCTHRTLEFNICSGQNYQCCCVWLIFTLRWRHNDHDGVSNHQPHDCLLNRSFRRRSKQTSKLRVTGLCAGNSPETGEFPAQMASYAENVSIWWRHHAWWIHQMKTFSALLVLCEGNLPVTGGYPSQRPMPRSFCVFMCAWTNGWANNWDAGDLRRHRAHHGVTVMYSPKPNTRTSFRNSLSKSSELDDLFMLTQSPKTDGLQVKVTDSEAGSSNCL